MKRNNEQIKHSTIHDESGRTMLEMLGVLAIMGIITYGAIAGINYGMTSYKINQTYSEVQDIIQGVQDLYSWTKLYPENSGNFLYVACQNDIFSSECIGCNKNEAAPPPTCSSAQGAFGDITLESILPERQNFRVKVYIPEETSRQRVQDMDWQVVNITCDCRTVTDWCIFTPN